MNHSIAIDHPCSPERIAELRWWTEEMLSFKSTRPLSLRFLPGQYARLALQSGSQLIWRPFSFVSAPDEDLLEFLAVLVPGGLFTDKLKQAEAGDTLWVEHENYGFMTPDRFSRGAHLWLLATGTGLGAFISILREGSIWSRYQRIIVVHGVRRTEELAYRDELLQMQADLCKQRSAAALSLLACITGDPTLQATPDGSASEDVCSGYRLLNSRMSRAWDEGTLEAAAGVRVNEHDSRVMLCGNPAMIDDMRKRLHQRGLAPCRRQTPGQFLTENYW